MSTQSTQLAYEVVLADDVATELGIDSPIETEHIDYYDAGLWVTSSEGRDFYPYEHVLTIRERPVTVEETGRVEAPGETQD